jgi:hypothetical protein
MPNNLNLRLCGSLDTQTGKPCRRKLPCPYHNDDGSRKSKAVTKRPNRDVLRHEKLLQMRLQGKSLQEAGREAGYSENTLKGKIYDIVESAEYQATIQARIAIAQIQTDEIIGVLVSHMRGDIADFFPEDDFLQEAKKRGISHLIKKVKRRPVVAGFDKDQNPIVAYETELEIQDQRGRPNISPKSLIQPIYDPQPGRPSGTLMQLLTE